MKNKIYFLLIAIIILPIMTLFSGCDISLREILGGSDTQQTSSEPLTKSEAIEAINNVVDYMWADSNQMSQTTSTPNNSVSTSFSIIDNENSLDNHPLNYFEELTESEKSDFFHGGSAPGIYTLCSRLLEQDKLELNTEIFGQYGYGGHFYCMQFKVISESKTNIKIIMNYQYSSEDYYIDNNQQSVGQGAILNIELNEDKTIKAFELFCAYIYYENEELIYDNEYLAGCVYINEKFYLLDDTKEGIEVYKQNILNKFIELAQPDAIVNPLDVTDIMTEIINEMTPPQEEEEDSLDNYPLDYFVEITDENEKTGLLLYPQAYLALCYELIEQDKLELNDENFGQYLWNEDCYMQFKITAESESNIKIIYDLQHSSEGYHDDYSQQIGWETTTLNIELNEDKTIKAFEILSVSIYYQNEEWIYGWCEARVYTNEKLYKLDDTNEGIEAYRQSILTSLVELTQPDAVVNPINITDIITEIYSQFGLA